MVSSRRKRTIATFLLPVLMAPALAGCMGYPIDPMAPTPASGGSGDGGAASRLPTLLQQLQNSPGGSVDFIDATPVGEVLGAQDEQIAAPTATPDGGKPFVNATPTPFQTVAGVQTPGIAATPTPVPSGNNQVAPTATPEAPTVTATVPGPTATPTQIPPTATPTRTPTPTPTLPTEGGSNAPTPTPSGPPTES
jgi:hypothetical protein